MTNVTGMKKALLGAVVFACGILAEHAAHATIVIGGASGFGQNNEPADCFIRNGPQISYDVNCGNNGGLTVPLPINAGNHSISVSGFGGNLGTECDVLVFAENGDQQSTGVSMSWNDGVTAVRSGSFSVPTNGSANLFCFMNHASAVNAISYNQ